MDKNQKKYRFSEETEIDYRKSHIGKDKAYFYEYEMYGKDSYDTAVWELEKCCLIKCIEKYVKNVDINYLDFACGSGRIISFLETKTKRSLGIDVSEDMLGITKNIVKKSKIIKGDITKEHSLIIGKFNLITSFRFFLNAQSSLRHKVLDVLYEKLTRDGILILNIHGNKFSLRLFSALLRKYIFQQTLNQLSFWEMKKILIEHNFKVVDLYGVGYTTRKLYKLFQKRLFYLSEAILGKIGFMKYFAVNFILVCKKIL